MSWQARIDINGEVCGSGFLATETHVLTCAHVIKEPGQIDVVFPNAGGLTIPATVLFRGPWIQDDDSGDVAVLELEHPAGIVPATFASFEAIDRHEGKQLYHSKGFPAGWDRGHNIEMTLKSRTRIGEAYQLDDVSGGRGLAGGFSGAAVCYETQVVGMITATNDTEANLDNFGLMIPTDVLCQYWEPLAETIGLGPIPPHAYGKLRKVLMGASIPHLRGIYFQVAPIVGPPQETARVTKTPMSALESLVESGRTDDESLNLAATFLAAACRNLPHGVLKEQLTGWISHFLLGNEQIEVRAVERPADRRGYVLVWINTTRDGRDLRHLTIWPVLGPHDDFGDSVMERIVPKSALRECAELGIQKAMEVLQGCSSIQVEFILPTGLLDLDVDLWTDLEDQRDGIPLSWNHPLFLRGLETFEGGHTRDLIQRTRALQQLSMEKAIQWKRCTTTVATPTQFDSWLRGKQRPVAVGLSGHWTGLRWIRAVVEASVPMIVWRRGQGHEHHDGHCAGEVFPDDLTRELHGVRFDTVTTSIRELRTDAGESESASHCGHDLVLFFEDSARRNREKLALRRKQ